jgi:plasmid stabilization system protein ParE
LGKRSVIQSPSFERYTKKQTKQFKRSLDLAVKEIVDQPEVGQEKRGDLRGVRVHKFKHERVLYLLAYIIGEATIELIMVGTHENYYRDLKNYTSK